MQLKDVNGLSVLSLGIPVQVHHWFFPESFP